MSAKPPQNPHSAAAGAYDTHSQKHTPNQRELEGRVLLKAAQKIQKIQSDWSNMTAEGLEEALNYNRQIWMMFVDTAVTDKNPDRPDQLRSNIANLGLFVLNHTIKLEARPEAAKLEVLININREVAAGLRAQTTP